MNGTGVGAIVGVALLVGLGVGVGFGPPVPLPDRRIFCGLFSALSLTNTKPFMPPLSDGAKLTLTVHCAPDPNVAPQVVVIGNTVELLEVIPPINIGTGLLFVNVTVLVVAGGAPTMAVPNAIERGAMVRTPCLPTPFIVTLGGFGFDALLWITSSPVFPLTPLGVKTIGTAHLVPGVMVVQLFGCTANSGSDDCIASMATGD